MKKSFMALIVMLSLLFFVTGIAISADTYHQRPIFNSPQHLSEVIGSDVVNHQGQELGSVHDLVANEEGQLEYLILSKDDRTLRGTELIAIPIDAVSPRMTRENQLTIDVDRETIDRAPTFSAGAYPDYADRRWQEESRGYFIDRDRAAPEAWRQDAEGPRGAVPREGEPLDRFGTDEAPGRDVRVDEGRTPPEAWRQDAEGPRGAVPRE
jgi:sporulation protein YlmC with PRC-barrel domain